MSLRQKTISGVGWTTTTRIGQQVLQFGIGVTLARLLTPEDFGLIGMITIFTGFASMYSDAGFGAALVQIKDIEERHRSSVFYLNVGLGVLLTGVMVLAAPLVAAFYDEPRLYSLTVFIAFQFFIGSLSTVPKVLLRRAMDFKPLTIIQLCVKVVSGTVAVGLALYGYGVWSLAYQTLISAAAGVVVVWILSPWRPHLIFDVSAIRELFAFSGNLLGFSTINYWTRNADNLLIGKFVGSAGLGIYTKAYGLMLLPIRQITSVISEVMFPALSRIQDDIQRVKRVYLKANRIIGLVTIPMMLGLMAVAHSFVLTVFGPKWEAVVPVLQILCFVGIKQPVGSTTGWLYMSQGRTDLQFKWNLVVSAVTVTSFVIGVQWGVLGVATAYAVRSYVVWYHGISIPGGLVGISFSEFVANLASIFGCAAFMAACVYLLGFALPPAWPHALQLVTQVFAGVVVYWGLVYGFGVQAYQETVDLLAEQWNRRMQTSA